MSTFTQNPASPADVGTAASFTSNDGGPAIGSGNSAVWLFQSNFAGAADSTFATCAVDGSTVAYTDILLGANLDVSSIPSSSTITDLSAAVTMKADTASSNKHIVDTVAGFWMNGFGGGSIQGSNLRRSNALGNRWPTTAGAITYTRGSGIAYSTLSNTSFGWAQAGEGPNNTASVTASLDAVAVTITYTAPAVSAFPAALVAIPWILLGGIWLPFTAAMARELGKTLCQFRLTVYPRTVISIPFDPPKRRPRLILPRRFQVDRTCRPAPVLAH